MATVLDRRNQVMKLVRESEQLLKEKLFNGLHRQPARTIWHEVGTRTREQIQYHVKWPLEDQLTVENENL